MLPGHGTRESCLQPGSDPRPIDPAVVEQAAQWWVALNSGTATAQERAAFESWIAEDPDHRRAWQRFSRLQDDLHRPTAAGLPGPAARGILDEALNHRRRALLKSFAGLGVVGMGGWLLHERMAWGNTWLADHGTATGERLDLVLEDRTRILLNTRTSIDVRFDAAMRQIVLYAGDIQVTTGADAAQRPFSVHTRDGTVTPVGTRFTVGYGRLGAHARRDASRVSVIEGRVDIRPGGRNGAVQLQAGQQTDFDRREAGSVRPLDFASIAWTEGMLVAEQMRLDDFIAELDRYRSGRLRCAPEVAGLKVSGSFPVDSPDAVLALLEETLPVRVRRFSRFWSTVSAR